MKQIFTPLEVLNSSLEMDNIIYIKNYEMTEGEKVILEQEAGAFGKEVAFIDCIFK